MLGALEIFLLLTGPLGLITLSDSVGWRLTLFLGPKVEPYDEVSFVLSDIGVSFFKVLANVLVAKETEFEALALSDSFLRSEEGLLKDVSNEVRFVEVWAKGASKY